MTQTMVSGRPIRAAVSVLFLANGLMIGSWAPKLPVLMQRLQIDEATAGLLVLCLGIGSVGMMPVFGALVARRGSASASVMAAWLAAPVLLLMTLAPNLWLVAGTVALFGAFLGGMDVAMNASAVAVERERGRAIMSSCHGFWSVGAAAGAGAGSWVMQHLGEWTHAVIVTAVFAALILWARGNLLQDAPAPSAPRVPLRLPRSPLPYILGLLALSCMIPEGAILDWAAVYLQRELGASLALAGWGFAACAISMAAMRFAGDVIRQRLGAVLTLRISAMVAMVGLAIAGFAGSVPMAIVGFGLAGLGIANMVPIVFSAAGNVPGLPQGLGLSVVTVMGYSGILLAPGSIGFLAEKIGFGPIYIGLALLPLIPLLLSRLAQTADFDTRH